MGKITNQVIKLAMQTVSKDVRLPKCVRDGIVKIKSNTEKIPTAEEFIEKYRKVKLSGEEYKAESILIEFAKLHVEAALKNASEKISDKKGKYIMPNKEFILISYPLENIK
jgi:hypothetical protein